MADLYVCRVVYQSESGIRSSVYTFKTTGFGTAESLGYAAVMKEPDYVRGRKVTSIKRKNISDLDNLSVGDGQYLYRATIKNLKRVYDDSSLDKYVRVSFVFPSSVYPSTNGLDIQQLTEDVKAHISNNPNYSWSNDSGHESDVIFSYEKGKKKLDRATDSVDENSGEQSSSDNSDITSGSDKQVGVGGRDNYL